MKGSAWNDATNYWLDVHDNAIKSSHLFRWKKLPIDSSLDVVGLKEIVKIIEPVKNEQIKSSIDLVNISISLDVSKISMLDKGKAYCIENAEPQNVFVVICLARLCRPIRLFK